MDIVWPPSVPQTTYYKQFFEYSRASRSALSNKAFYDTGIRLYWFPGSIITQPALSVSSPHFYTNSKKTAILRPDLYARREKKTVSLMLFAPFFEHDTRTSALCMFLM